MEPDRSHFVTGRTARQAAALFVFLCAFYSLFLGGIQADNLVDLAATRSAAEGRGFRVPDPSPLFAGLVRADAGGAYRPKRGFGYPLLALPFYCAGEKLGAVLPGFPERPEDRGAFGASLVGPFVSALAAAAVFLLLVTLRYDPRLAAASALAYALCTHAFAHARYTWNNAGETAAILGAVALLAAFERFRKARLLLLAGAAAGFGMAIRYETALAAATGGLFLLLAKREQTESWRARLRSLALFLAPVLAVGVALALANRRLFGGATDTAYGNEILKSFTLRGLGGSFLYMLFGSESGLIFYSPGLLVGCAGAYLFVRAHRRAGLLVLGTALVLLVLYACWDATRQDNTWGNRFLLPVGALAMIPCAEVLARFDLRKRSLESACVAGVLAFGLCVQLLGSVVLIYNRTWTARFGQTEPFQWFPERIVVQARELWAGHCDIWWLGRAYAEFPEAFRNGPLAPEPAQWPSGAWGVAALVTAVLAAIGLYRSLGTARGEG